MPVSGVSFIGVSPCNAYDALLYQLSPALFHRRTRASYVYNVCRSVIPRQTYIVDIGGTSATVE